MQRPAWTGALGIAITYSCVAVPACDRSPTSPGSPVVLTGLAISGPASAKPGDTLSFSATASYSNGSSRDVTPYTAWSVVGGPALTVSTGGSAVAIRAGEAEIRASYQEPLGREIQRVTASTNVLVLAPGTFKVSGRVTEVGGAPLFAGVLVTVVSGNLQGSVSGLANGQYAFYGATGPIELEVSGPNYQTLRHNFLVTSNTIHDFALVSLANPVDVGGVWTLTLVDPAPGCPPGFPSAARGRTYTLKLTQQGTHLAVDLSRPGLSIVLPELFSGSVDHDQVSVDLPSILDDFTGALSPNIIDRISGTETLSFGVVIRGTVSGSEIVATTAGTIYYWAAAITGAPAWECTAANHAFVLRR